MARGWETFEHEADVGVRGRGATLGEAFEQAALALTSVVTDPERVRSRESVSISCAAADEEALLVEWLNAVVYEMATRRLLFGAFEVSVEGGRLTGTAHGEPVDRSRHEPAVEVKGATFTALRVAREGDGGVVAQCVVDV